jgi:hypothetical protein
MNGDDGGGDHDGDGDGDSDVSIVFKPCRRVMIIRDIETETLTLQTEVTMGVE